MSSGAKLTVKDASDVKAPPNLPSLQPESNGRHSGPGFGCKSVKQLILTLFCWPEQSWVMEAASGRQPVGNPSKKDYTPSSSSSTMHDKFAFLTCSDIDIIASLSRPHAVLCERGLYGKPTIEHFSIPCEFEVQEVSPQVCFGRNRFSFSD